MVRFGFEPVDLFDNGDCVIGLIGYCPADADEWGGDLLVYIPHKGIALPLGDDDKPNLNFFNPEELEAIQEVFLDLLNK